MEYVELKYIVGHGDEGLTEELMAILSEFGYESFVEENDRLLAYIPTVLFDTTIFDNKELWPDSSNLDRFSWEVIPEQNWNAVWEENFQPVTIAGKCHIRAPFHESNNQVSYEIIIEPKMSFGTAHHETTAQMIQYLLEIDLSGKRILDMGCGTGVLAILAALKGGSHIMAIDIDEWAYNNTIENIERNNTTSINVLLGDASLLKDQKFDTIIANINRNILLNDIPVYVECLGVGGLLLLSGFYIEDLPAITQMSASAGLEYISHKEQNRWVAACFEKTTG
jgi:ribosomal protein L11 methyltransferase